MRLTFTAALLASAFATTAADAQDNRALVRYIDSVSNAAIAEKRTAGVSVAVVKNGRPIVSKGYGFADLENDVPATAETARGAQRCSFEAAAHVWRGDDGSRAVVTTHATTIYLTISTSSTVECAGRPIPGAWWVRLH